MYRKRGAVAFLLGILVLVVPFAFAGAAGKASDAMCTAGDYGCACGWDGKECANKDASGKTCMQGKPCQDSDVKGECINQSFCGGESCFVNGAWGKCTLPKLDVQSLQSASQPAPATPGASTVNAAPALPPLSNQLILNALQQAPSNTGQETIAPSVAPSLNDLMTSPGSAPGGFVPNTGSVQGDLFMSQTPTSNNLFQLQSGVVPEVPSAPVPTAQESGGYAGQSTFGQPTQTNQQLVQQASTLQPASDCGNWLCSSVSWVQTTATNIGDYLFGGPEGSGQAGLLSPSQAEAGVPGSQAAPSQSAQPNVTILAVTPANQDAAAPASPDQGAPSAVVATNVTGAANAAPAPDANTQNTPTPTAASPQPTAQPGQTQAPETPSSAPSAGANPAPSSGMVPASSQISPANQAAQDQILANRIASAPASLTSSVPTPVAPTTKLLQQVLSEDWAGASKTLGTIFAPQPSAVEAVPTTPVEQADLPPPADTGGNTSVAAVPDSSISEADIRATIAESIPLDQYDTMTPQAQQVARDVAIQSLQSGQPVQSASAESGTISPLQMLMATPPDTTAPAPAAQTPNVQPLSDADIAAQIPVPEAALATPQGVDPQVQSVIDQKIQSAQVQVQYFQGLVDRSDSPTAQAAAQALLDESNQRLNGVVVEAINIETNNPSPQEQAAIDAITQGQGSGILAGALQTNANQGFSLANNLGSSINPSDMSLGDVAKGAGWLAAETWGGVNSAVADLGGKIGLPGFGTDPQTALGNAIDPYGSEYQTLANVATVMPFGVGAAKMAGGIVLDAALGSSDSATWSALPKSVTNDVLFSDSAGLTTPVPQVVVDAVAPSVFDTAPVASPYTAIDTAVADMRAASTNGPEAPLVAAETSATPPLLGAETTAQSGSLAGVSAGPRTTPVDDIWDQTQGSWTGGAAITGGILCAGFCTSSAPLPDSQTLSIDVVSASNVPNLAPFPGQTPEPSSPADVSPPAQPVEAATPPAPAQPPAPAESVASAEPAAPTQSPAPSSPPSPPETTAPTPPSEIPAQPGSSGPAQNAQEQQQAVDAQTQATREANVTAMNDTFEQQKAATMQNLAEATAKAQTTLENAVVAQIPVPNTTQQTGQSITSEINNQITAGVPVPSANQQSGETITNQISSQIEAGVPVPNATQQTGQAITNQINEGIQSGIPTAVWNSGLFTSQNGQSITNQINGQIEAAIPVPNTSQQSGQSMTNQINTQIESGIPTAVWNPGLLTSQSGQSITSEINNQIAAAVPVPNTNQQTGQSITNQINGQIEAAIPVPAITGQSGQAVTDQINADNNLPLPALVSPDGTPAVTAGTEVQEPLNSQQIASSLLPAPSDAGNVPQDASKAPSVSLDINFKLGSPAVDTSGPNGMVQIASLADAMKQEQFSNYTFQIVGHTDTVGTPESNLVLSQERAQAVVDILNQQYGVPLDQMTASGVGQDDLEVPILGNVPANRRVVITATPK